MSDWWGWDGGWGVNIRNRINAPRPATFTQHPERDRCNQSGTTQMICSCDSVGASRQTEPSTHSRSGPRRSSRRPDQRLHPLCQLTLGRLSTLRRRPAHERQDGGVRQWRNSTTSWRRCRTNAACLAAQNRSARLVQDVQDIRARMQPWQGTQAVKVLDERLGESGLRVGVGR